VLDSARNVIVVFDADERYVTTFAHKDFNPVDVTIWQNELFVSDFEASMVKVLDARTGAILRTIGSPGTGDGQFARPLGIRMDNQGNLLVADVMNCRVQKFTRDGKFLLAFGRTGDRPGEFVRPKHLTTDSQGKIYVVDAAFSNVQVFDDRGRIAGFFGSLGNHPGSMNLPAGIWISETDLDLFADYIHPAFQANRLIIVTNQFGADKVAVYAEGQLKPGKTVADLHGSRSEVETGLASETAPTSQPITIGVPLPPELLPTTTPTGR
jgi:DNA-binding beta-propeller fold protein YncE